LTFEVLFYARAFLLARLNDLAWKKDMARPNVVLINPPNPRNLVADRDAAGGFGVLRTKEQIAFPPLTLLYSASVLERRRFPLRVLDCSAMNYDEKKAIKNCCSFEPRVAVVLTSTPTFNLDCSFARQLKKQSEEITLIMIGPMVRVFPTKTLNLSGADFGVLGEPENVLPDLIGCIHAHKSLVSMKGLVFRRSEGLVSTGDAPLLKNLDALPYPAWHLLPYKRFFFTISSSRGCPYGCFYCPYVISQGLEYRFRSPENVVNEMRYLKERFGAKLIQFRDPTFSFLKERAKDICRLIMQKKVDVDWIVETRPETVDFELLGLLAKAGCCEMLLGVESGSKRILDSMGRLLPKFSADAYLDHVRKIVERARSLGVVPLAFFMLGLPEENWDTALATINFAKGLRTAVQFSIASPYPGTKFSEMANSEGLISDSDLSKMDTYTCSVVRTRYLSTEDLERIVRRANYEVRAQKGLETLARKNIRFLPMHFLHFLAVKDKVGFAKKGAYTITNLLKKKNRD